ncbi:SCO family protein [Chenggangzhangella methanolivorans]|uniref:SCO family protein n=1 Tax=Chenggangzhangella methanolivorans TaxID=1437009 RepID=A0A9E6UPI3_9HYPH|nr:SCO family protein [Chenggangzhangella methanolivorans]QZO01444.1 SCO family protein [Chenggangzhangella methanolivorans]
MRSLLRRPLALAAAAIVLLAAGAAAAMLAVERPRSAALPELPAEGAAGETETHAMPFGPIRPARALPDVALTRHDGKATTLSAETSAGRFTLVTLFFAGCSTTCPVQGAIFKAAQERIAARNLPADLLSLSVDALGDDPARLTSWLEAQGAAPGWRAATPTLEGVGRLVDALKGRGRGYDVHDARIYLVDPRGRLVYVTEDMPSPDALATLVAEAQVVMAEKGAAGFD